MADADDRHRTLKAPGTSAAAATGLVARTLAERSGLTVHEVGPGRISVSRTRRPRWALALCACTFWLGGLGFLFLLVKQTDAGEVVVSDGPRGCVVTVPPLLAGAAADELVRALATSPLAVTPDPSTPDTSMAEPATMVQPDRPVADGLEGRTVARRDLPPPPGDEVVSPRAAEGAATLRFEAGDVLIEAGGRVVLGRDPSPAGRAPGRVVPGDASTVSKSHLVVTFDGHAVTVEDLGSTNGTQLVRGSASEPLAPGVETEVAPGDRVVMGAVAFVVDRSAE